MKFAVYLKQLEHLHLYFAISCGNTGISLLAMLRVSKAYPKLQISSGRFLMLLLLKSKKCKNLTFPICAGNSCNELLDKSSQVSLCSLSMLSGIKDIPLFDKIIFWMFGFFTVAGGISVSLLSERFISAVNS
jgi:hypothetical protein